jgi:hypothetical protein
MSERLVGLLWRVLFLPRSDWAKMKDKIKICWKQTTISRLMLSLKLFEAFSMFMWDKQVENPFVSSICADWQLYLMVFPSAML